MVKLDLERRWNSPSGRKAQLSHRAATTNDVGTSPPISSHVAQKGRDFVPLPLPLPHRPSPSHLHTLTSQTSLSLLLKQIWPLSIAQDKASVTCCTVSSPFRDAHQTKQSQQQNPDVALTHPLPCDSPPRQILVARNSHCRKPASVSPHNSRFSTRVRLDNINSLVAVNINPALSASRILHHQSAPSNHNTLSLKKQY